MLRKMTIISVLGAMVSAMFATMPAHANQSPGVGVAAFGCNITIHFPASPKQPALTNCNGDAYGAAVFAAGPKAGTASISVGSLDKKDSLHNFQAYNVEYFEPCVATEPVPLIGFANGHAIIAGTTGKRIHTFFEWTRIGVIAVVQLFNTHSEFGGLNKTHKTKKDGTSLGKGDPNFDGVALAAFEAKPPVGSCTTPLETAINVVGVVIAGVNLKDL